MLCNLTIKILTDHLETIITLEMRVIPPPRLTRLIASTNRTRQIQTIGTITIRIILTMIPTELTPLISSALIPIVRSSVISVRGLTMMQNVNSISLRRQKTRFDAGGFYPRVCLRFNL